MKLPRILKFKLGAKEADKQIRILLSLARQNIPSAPLKDAVKKFARFRRAGK